MNAAILWEQETIAMCDRMYSTKEKYIPCQVCGDQLSEYSELWKQAHILCPDSWVCCEECAEQWVEKNWETVEELDDENT